MPIAEQIEKVRTYWLRRTLAKIRARALVVACGLVRASTASDSREEKIRTSDVVMFADTWALWLPTPSPGPAQRRW
eukprot:8018995-Pyramimonas_sp.AAC.1